ncbi:hypothetical protein ACNQ17_02125 [Mycoplasma sp. Sp48II]|uniref:hypothetical protein n=1 Tax=unclassified Mycoplasma TaxID=2683645 RepID=UPI003AAA4573
MKKIKLLLNSIIGTTFLALPALSVVACGTKDTEVKGPDVKPFLSLYSKLEFTYKGNKAETYAKDAKAENIEIKGYNKEEFQITIKSVEPESYLATTISIKYEIIDLKTNSKSNELVSTISGFKAEEASK